MAQFDNMQQQMNAMNRQMEETMAENMNFREYFKKGLLKADENGVVNVVYDPEERAAIEASYSVNEAQSEEPSQMNQ